MPLNPALIGELIPLVPYALIAAGLLTALRLFVHLQRDLQIQQFRWNQRQQALQAEVGRIRGALLELQLSLEESAGAAASAPAPPVNGMNLNRRAQALRLARRGERPPQIAAALGIPQNEVELLLKLHQTASGN